MSHDGLGPRAAMRSVAFLTAGALAVPLLSACSAEDEAGKPLAAQDIAPAARAQIADGGTLRWAVDAVPETLNTFQADADATTTRVAQAVLPSMYRLDANGRPRANPDFLESAEVVDTEPRQVVLYRLNQQAVWSDGREIGAADFAAQWRALSGKDSAYWTARNAGYDRIEKIERGANDLEVRVTFARPYADWRSLFSPLYPKDVMGTPDAFNDGARRRLKVTAGPFALKQVDREKDRIRLTRNPRWWGRPAKLTEIVLAAVPRDERAAHLAEGDLDVAEIDPAVARGIDSAAGAAGPLSGPGAGRTAAKVLRSWAVVDASDADAEENADADQDQNQGDRDVHARGDLRRAVAAWERQRKELRGYEVRKSLEPAYTQLALNGADGPLADERVRRAVARALDRKELAKVVLKPLGLPAVPVGSHLALSGQEAYADNSGALGGQDTEEAQALLADAGWVAGGPVEKGEKGEKAAGSEGETAEGEKSDGEKSDGEKSDGEKEAEGEGDRTADDGEKAGRDDRSEGGDDGTYIVGQDGKAPAEHGRDHEDHGRRLAQDGKQYLNRQGAPGAYAPRGTAAPAGAAREALAKDGKALTLRFVLPTGPGSDSLHLVAGRITRMLEKVGIRTETTKVSDESYFKDHIASGDYDLALYSWPASAFPATDARPIYAKPVPGADGSLSVEQNYTRVGTDQVDQLFDQAVSTLDEEEGRSLIRKADARIWAAAGSIPLYQRPQLTAVRKNLVNVGAFGFQTPVYEDMGFLKKGVKVSASPSRK
ncbi:ABC transporter substrate-binding protein [Streptomyces phaeoluteigriseus]|uniref:ABC transporter substrate-binding protein n=1 Tax=Streptomyces phaeoluteigriseus TaxID=114686 RepID=A0ABY4Z339_9ACTN|nr:ABC transporter substrate-binding protein [Streptomyces phaeoluteigriseus]USQ83301.1 ABC transporter substrate-binding protein [Streptomyces phaeoluteigriseus]